MKVEMLMSYGPEIAPTRPRTKPMVPLAKGLTRVTLDADVPWSEDDVRMLVTVEATESDAVRTFFREEVGLSDDAPEWATIEDQLRTA